MHLDVRAISPEQIGDFLGFFDAVAFTDNPDWASCYCSFYHHDPAEKPWEQRTAAENRACSADLIAAGKLAGYLAYAEGRPVGWCNANDKRAYALLAKDAELWDPEEKPGVRSVVCFVVAPEHRGKGVARTLLEAACAPRGAARAADSFHTTEAYPRKNAVGQAANYHGTLSMFVNAGFSIHRELESLWIVRKPLPKRRITVLPHDPEWPAEYARESEALRRALGDALVSVHHIGSTSVPGLAAKPVIDIVVEATSLDAVDAHAAAIGLLGYEALGEHGIPGRRYFLKGLPHHSHHVHAYVRGDPNVRRHVAFRDYLRTHPDRARAYGELKAALAARDPEDVDGYISGKDTLAGEIEAEALRWSVTQENPG